MPVDRGVDRVVGWAAVVEIPHVAENLVAQSLKFLVAAALL